MSHLKPQGSYALRLNTFAQSDIQYNIERGPEASTGEGFLHGKFLRFRRDSGGVYNLAFFVRRYGENYCGDFFSVTGLWKCGKCG